MTGSGARGGVIRRVRATEGQVFRGHLLRLDAVSRRSRFGGAVSDAFVEIYARRAFDDEGVILGWFADGTLRAAAELRPLAPRWRARAEAAFSVEQDWQDTGVGTALLAAITRAARNRGLSRLIVICLPENARMQRIAAKQGARLVWHTGDVEGRLEPPGPTPWSLWREAMDEGCGLVSVLFPSPRRRRAE